MIPSLAVCAIVRNESAGIEEWINHYLVRGVSHFFIIDDGSDDGCYEILKKHEGLGYLTVINPQVPREADRQNAAYNQYIMPLIGDYDWVAIVDADEFLWDSEGLLLPEYLSNISEEISMVNVVMSDFGDNGLIAQPKGIVNSFTRRARSNESPKWYHLKSICRVSRLSLMHTHLCEVVGERIIDKHRLKLNHYKLQSLERWTNLVIPRGSASCTVPGRVRHSDYYFKKNSERMNAVEDLGLILQNNQIK
jgi:glycosyltransferase involved in cell wall biosynthesis